MALNVRPRNLIVMALAHAYGLFGAAAPRAERRRNAVQPPAPTPRPSRRPLDAWAPRMVVAREPRLQAQARRRQQIERGQLTISNGLVVPGLRYLGHGLALHVESGRVIGAH